MVKVIYKINSMTNFIVVISVAGILAVPFEIHYQVYENTDKRISVNDNHNEGMVSVSLGATSAVVVLETGSKTSTVSSVYRGTVVKHVVTINYDRDGTNG